MRKTKSLQKIPFPAPDVVTKVVPVPTDGWDAISPLASMDPKRAPILINWVPRPGYVEIRQGFAPWTWLGATNAVNSLMVWRDGIADKMFAAMGDGIYDVSVSGSVITKTVSGLSSSKWQYVNFTPALGSHYIQCVNGVDSLRMFDGTTWTTPSITGLPGGLNSSAIINIYAQKRRLWYILTNGSGGGSTIAAFMPTDAISGAIAGTLDLGSLWTKGGFLVAMSDWTVDGGNGPQDYAAFISTRGQVAIYSGTDPTSSTAWTLVGVFDLSPPIGYRCTLKVGSDVAVITQQGVLPLSTALPFDPSADRSVAITARIQNAMAQAAQLASGNFGWQLISFPMQNLAILNVPLVLNTNQVQFVMNTLTGAWTQFQGWNANCFEIYEDNLFFGGNDGTVNQAYTGGLDLNMSISTNMQCAFNYFDDPGRIKRMTMVQPLMVAGGTVTPKISVDADFGTSTSIAPVSIIAGGASWDSGTWDTSVWPGVTQVVNPMLSVQAIGRALAIHMTANIAPVAVPSTVGEFDVALFDSGQFDVGVSNIAPSLQINAFNSVLELGGFV